MSTGETLALVAENCMRNYGAASISVKSGKGCRLYDEEGRAYLDFVAGIAVNALGYGDEDERKALLEVLDGGVLHTSNLYAHPRAAKLAKALNEAAGSDAVFFCNSGAEANEAAIKLAKKRGLASGGDKIIAFESSFHGRTCGALSVTGREKYRKNFSPLVPNISFATYNDLSSVEKLIDAHTAAVIVEPLQGEGGVVPATQSFLQGLRDLCDRNGALLIYDEVQCGLGRTGKPFCFQRYGVRPDVMSLAKALGGGLPMGACLAWGEAAEVFAPGDHASTFGGNVAASALALVLMDKLPTLCENVEANGPVFKLGLEKLAAKRPGKCSEVRGMGYMLGLDLKVPVGDVVKACAAKGLLVCSAGANTLRFVPPLVASIDDITEALGIVDEVLAEI